MVGVWFCTLFRSIEEKRCS
ncbi:unnamed protein product [Acanthoscelides obtectus]|uniref:Uncharacterized protein n=1 Tax=Acanthoscelides obtectus TaxID=200917 RepID=A0A9P0PNI9_ACAOB|nr:unnamed protein product [Acanthoscelides obtectus]CAK1662651.1 hypothetical protein AOBTE_LOCUS23253 [Acanthoscelides obtectus]